MTETEKSKHNNIDSYIMCDSYAWTKEGKFLLEKVCSICKSQIAEKPKKEKWSVYHCESAAKQSSNTENFLCNRVLCAKCYTKKLLGE